MRNRPLQAVSGLEGPHLTELLSRALSGAGPALLPITADLPAPQVRALLDAMRPASLRTPDGVTPLPDGTRVRDDTALVIATSGSTGTPKGAELSAAALTASARASTARLGAGAGRTWLCVLPTAHISGLQVILRALVTGGEVRFARFDPAAVPDDTPYVSLVPTQLRRALAAGTDLSAYAAIALGGAAAGAGLLDAARAAGARVATTYGMSETCGGCVYDGVPLDGVRAETDPEGRVLLSGPVLFSGYRLRPDLSDEHLVPGADGRTWFRTGDIGRVGADGALRVLGRLDDVINTGGHKVVPGEVAEALSRHPAVADVAVVGRADPEWGHRVAAVVVPADPADPPALSELREHVRTLLPAWAAPKELDLRAALPLLASGKPDLRALREPAPDPGR